MEEDAADASGQNETAAKSRHQLELRKLQTEVRNLDRSPWSTPATGPLRQFVRVRSGTPVETDDVADSRRLPWALPELAQEATIRSSLAPFS
jgi:hypothetical protein